MAEDHTETAQQTTAVTGAPILEDERSKVEGWRLHVLIEAGYSLFEAERLAVSGADLHEACELIERGCPSETAARILI